jgi:hypothetical protein
MSVSVEGLVYLKRERAFGRTACLVGLVVGLRPILRLSLRAGRKPRNRWEQLPQLARTGGFRGLLISRPSLNQLASARAAIGRLAQLNGPADPPSKQGNQQPGDGCTAQYGCGSEAGESPPSNCRKCDQPDAPQSSSHRI